MKKFLLIISFVIIALMHSNAAEPKPYISYSKTMFEGEEIDQINLSGVFIFTDNWRGRRLSRQYARLLLAVRVGYPIARYAKFKLNQMENALDTLPKSQHKEYSKGVEEELKKQFTPILKRMSIYQGIVLLKLIDRQTGNTSYELVQELRGNFSAFFWQGIARFFGTNLKTEYDPKEDDKILEELIQLYEQGLV